MQRLLKLAVPFIVWIRINVKAPDRADSASGYKISTTTALVKLALST